MTLSVGVTVGVAFGLSIVLNGLYLMAARRMQVVDTPDHRSAHQHPTPHGGGVALIGAFALVTASAAFGGLLPVMPWLPVIAAALVLVVLGIVDDLRNLDYRWRLAVHVLLCFGIALGAVSGMTAMAGLTALLLACAIAAALVVLLNFYNFMDGIDGIAASQTVLACTAAACFSVLTGGDRGYALVCAVLAASHLGFLVWNWPPARLFMGDAGSIPTGFLLGVLALLGQLTAQVDVATWGVLLAVFVVDAGWTLGWRIVTGQPFTQPHREHAYQRLSRRWNSHARVDGVLIATSIVWLVPLAWLTHKYPSHALFLVILAYLPLLAYMAKIRRLH